MVDIQHKNITGADAAHPPFYASESDPTTTLGAYRGWFKPSTGEAWIRNATNTDWISIAGGGGSVSAATEGAAGIAELATQTETDTGTDDGRIVTPLKAATRFLAKAGGTLTGFLTLHADPTSAMHPATKQYADALVGGGASPASETTAGIAELATQSETNTGTDDARIVTPLKLATRTSTETRAGIVELATDAETQTGTDTARAITPANLSARSATETRAGVAEVATQTETNTGTDDARLVTPAKLAGRTATDTRAGVVELATDAETQTGTDTARAITPANLSAKTATETRSGTAEIATQGETDTGTDDNRIVTPLKAATRFLAKAGGTLTGFLTLHADPTSALHAVTKQYADGLVSGGASPASETTAGIAELATQAETNTGTDDSRIVTPLKLANYSGLGGGGGTPEAMHVLGTGGEPTLQNSWVTFGTSSPGFYKHEERVYLQGMISSGTTGANTVLFTLPAGYRPAASQFFTTTSRSGASTYVTGNIEVTTGGDVLIKTGGNNNLALNGVNFRV